MATGLGLYSRDSWIRFTYVVGELSDTFYFGCQHVTLGEKAPAAIEHVGK